MTIEEILAEITSDISRSDAEILLAHALQADRAALITRAQDEVAEGELAYIREIAGWRAAGQPVAHITNTKSFYGLDFFVDETVLIPRPETEQIVDEALTYIGDQALTVLDVGTGSGCIAIAIAKNTAHTTVYASDTARAALDITEKNAESHEVDIETIQSDVLTEVDIVPQVIVSNPPYIATGDPAVDQDVVKYEPSHALFAKDEGLDLIRQLLTDIAEMDTKPQLVLIEHGTTQGPATRQIAEGLLADAQIETLSDLAGHDRILKIQV